MNHLSDLSNFISELKRTSEEYNGNSKRPKLDKSVDESTCLDNFVSNNLSDEDQTNTETNEVNDKEDKEKGL